jgi:hypothetical protein
MIPEWGFIQYPLRRASISLKAQSVPRSKHSPSQSTNQLMLYTAKVAVCSETHTTHIHSYFSGRTFLNLPSGGTYSNRQALKV